LNDVGDSIVDYLKNGRPETASEYIFVKHCAPYEQFASSGALYQVMIKYLQMAKLSAEAPRRAGLHVLRHSLASVLLEQETPLPVITEILGHLNTNTTRIYTSIDIKQLKKCALDAPVFLDGGERL
jgi:site-specific recombinase XerD